MSSEEKQHLKEEFINEDGVEEQPQRLFHLNRLPANKKLFEFESMTKKIELKKTPCKRDFLGPLICLVHFSILNL